MDQMFFSIKRVHHGGLRFGHEVTRRFGLTPARFDLLFLLKQWRSENLLRISQRELRTTLGVSAPTVSRMLRSLEKLALVWRGPRWRNTREVALTTRGLALIKQAAKAIVFNGLARRFADRALRRGSKDYDFMRRDTLDELLSTMRRFFRDVATLYYPWHPDD